MVVSGFFPPKRTHMKLPPEKTQDYWENIFNDHDSVESLEWEEIHNQNFKCTIPGYNRDAIKGGWSDFFHMWISTSHGSIS
jgi:hypothetical protein